MKMILVIFLYICTFLLGASSGELQIALHETNTSQLQNDDTVQIIEGDHLLLVCTHDTMTATFTWRRESKIITRSGKFELQNIRIEDEGVYTCTLSSSQNFVEELLVERTTVYVKVLYPPTYPFVEVPKSVLADEELSLTCLVDAEPPPTYQWRRDSKDGLLLSRKKTYQFTVPSSSFKIYCIIQNVMTPTDGELKSVFVTRTISINVHRKAAITSMSPYLYVDKREGDNVVLACYIGGKPIPMVWWSKSGEDSFYWPGGRYSSYNINKSISGDYVCHVENTVVYANGSSQIIHKTKVVHVRVFGKKTNNVNLEIKCADCLEHCTSVSTLKNTTPRYTNLANASSVMPTDYPNSIESRKCSEHSTENLHASGTSIDIMFKCLIVATATGWVLFMVMVVYNIYFRKHNKAKKMERQMPQSIAVTENECPNSDHTSTESSYVTMVRIPEHMYTDLTTYDQISSRNDNNIQSIL